ncbi:MAG: hypothetical protein QNI86_10625 [Halieaceae bacterium]|nr:hypothetical protein [Halieaceae bacterium]
MIRICTIVSLLALVASGTALADENKLGNNKLKDKGYERLEGRNRFKVGCSHIIRSDDRRTVYHPTVLTNEEIGLDYQGSWVSVASGDKTNLQGVGKVTVWRNCGRIN